MNDKSEENEGGSKFQFLQPNRDLESNWEVDLAKKLEDYLLRICSGEITGDDDGTLSVNFAEAALVIQGSVQVYSRKVEYLHSLVLLSLEFLSKKSKLDQGEKQANQPDENIPFTVGDEENDKFLGLDDVPVDTNNALNDGLDEEDNMDRSVKVPSSMLVLEGDCLDSGGDAGELESFLLATSNLYGDFILLDPSDAVTITELVRRNNNVDQNTGPIGSSGRSKTRRSFVQSPTLQSGGTAYKSVNEKKLNDNLQHASGINHEIGLDENVNIFFESGPCHNDMPDNNLDYTMEFDGEHPGDNGDTEDDEDDPWKPLNPHEPGKLKVKPFKKGKDCGHRIGSYRQNHIALQFPVATLDGTICPEFADMLKAQNIPQKCYSPPLYEKLRSSLVLGDSKSSDDFHGFNNTEDGIGVSDFPDFEDDDAGIRDHMHMDADVPLPFEKQYEDNFDGNISSQSEEPCSQASLEDLCRSHLDALLASIAETEKQTELAARVSTWKQGIEHAIDEQDSHPPFDIHAYGERVLKKLSEANGSGHTSFTEVVRGQADYDVARTFSALLQLVNNRDVDIKREDPGGESCVCYTAERPFSVHLLKPSKGVEEPKSRCSSRKRVKSPKRNDLNKALGKKLRAVTFVLPTSPRKSTRKDGKSPVSLYKSSLIKRTPEGKRRRRSWLVDPVDLQSAR